MRNRVPYGVKFISRFFLEIVPPVLAAVIGGFLFAHYYVGSPGSEQNAAEALSGTSPDGRAALVDEEHAQLGEFLKQGREAAKPGSDASGPTTPAKPRSVVVKDPTAKDPKIRRAPMPIVAEGQPKPAPAASPPTVATTSGPPGSAQPTRVATNPVPPADIPNVSPLAAIPPQTPPPVAASAPASSEQTNVFGSMLSKASEIKDKTIDFVRDIPGRVWPAPEKTGEPGTGQRFSQTSPE